MEIPVVQNNKTLKERFLSPLKGPKNKTKTFNNNCPIDHTVQEEKKTNCSPLTEAEWGA